MKKTLVVPTLLFLLVFASACSERYRKASSGTSGDEIYAYLSDIVSGNVPAGTNVYGAVSQERLDELLDAGRTYFAESPGAMGPIRAVTPLNVEVITPDTNLQSIEQIDHIRVFFIVAKTSGNKYDAMLIFDTQYNGGDHSIHIFNPPDDIQVGEINDDVFEMVLAGDSGFEIKIESEEASSDGLDKVIQLQFFEPGGDSLGQVSSLEGFDLFL